jgi:4'-phosphopantetheinyl transferase
MIDVYWIEQTEADVPPQNDWLNAREARRLNDMRFPKRRSDWRLGRWTAKRALALCLDRDDDFRSLAEIEIHAAASGAPEVYVTDHPADVNISLSHSSGRAVCALTHAAVALGCDLEVIESRGVAFILDYFTTDEQRLIARSPAADRARLATLLWSGKESALKALQTGLRLDTRSVVVFPMDTSSGLDSWHPLEIRRTGCHLFHGWWQHFDGFLRTLVSAPRANPPTCLSVPALGVSQSAAKPVDDGITVPRAANHGKKITAFV